MKKMAAIVGATLASQKDGLTPEEITEARGTGESYEGK
jgi:hypothetical protein